MSNEDFKKIKIFTSNGKDGINVIESPVKLTIIDMLKESDMEFDEIVLNTGKSKSTISVHLKALRENGIISYRIGPDDNRKKIFYLNSRLLGSINIDQPNKIKEATSEFLTENLVNNQVNFTTLLFHTLRAILIQEGISIDPFLYETGLRIGEAVFPSLYDKDLDKFSSNIINFWEEKGLGKLNVKLGQIIKVTNEDCFECVQLPRKGTPMCYFDSGFLESLFSLYFDLPLNIIETKCYTMGDSCCQFEIEPLSFEKIERQQNI